MTKRNQPRRRTSPSPAMSSLFASTLIQFTSEFLKSESFGHALSKGEEREQPIIKFLSDLLPSTFSVGSGEVIDLEDRKSPQLDVMVWDKVRNFAFYSGAKAIIPAEALIISIEVKSRLTKDELRKSLIASSKLHNLKPFNKPLSMTRTDGDSHDGQCRYFHCIFAYGTDLKAGGNYLLQESKRYSELISELELPEDVIQRIYVANRGLLNPGKDFGIGEDVKQGRALMQFYLDIFNFLTRENNRREAVPYNSYVGRIQKGNWVKLRGKNT